MFRGMSSSASRLWSRVYPESIEGAGDPGFNNFKAGSPLREDDM